MGEEVGLCHVPDCTNTVLSVLRASSCTVQLFSLGADLCERELRLEVPVRSLVGASPTLTGSCV